MKIHRRLKKKSKQPNLGQSETRIPITLSESVESAVSRIIETITATQTPITQVVMFSESPVNTKEFDSYIERVYYSLLLKGY